MSRHATPLPPAVRDEVLCIADSKWVLGHWYIKLIQNGRGLTDFNALAAMAQDQLGHTRALFSLLEQQPHATRDQLEFSRDRYAVASMQLLDAPPQGWADFIVTAALVEYALRTLFGAYRAGNHPALAALAAHSERECEFHSLYLDGGLQGLGAEEIAAARSALAMRAPLAFAWLGDASEDPIAAAGLRDAPLAALRERYAQTCTAGIARHLGVALPYLAPAAGDWDAQRRRTRGTAMPATLWEFVVPTSEQAVLCRRPLQVSSADSIRFTKGA